jgi:hypothetical protein|tara:strand:- start:3334 stop:3528 length:195 start_codon:yes stop_codon:yes gene_type:complete
MISKFLGGIMSEKNFNIAGPESWKGTPPMDQRIYSDPQPMTNLQDLAGRLTTDLRPDANKADRE